MSFSLKRVSRQSALLEMKLSQEPTTSGSLKEYLTKNYDYRPEDFEFLESQPELNALFKKVEDIKLTSETGSS